MALTILLTGGSGAVGTEIKQQLTQKGFRVNNLSRKPKQNGDYFWNVETQEIDIKAFENVDVIIHLAGTGIAEGNWSEAHKNEIYTSRIGSTRLLYHTCKKNSIKIKHFISTSAIGIYGQHVNNASENTSFGSDFLANVCKDWEASANLFREMDTQVSIVRTGIVLDAHSGYVPQVLKGKFFRIFPTTGKPTNGLSWIHIADLAAMYIALALGMLPAGIYNGTAPNPVTQMQMMQAIANNYGGGLVPNVPEMVLKLALGEKSVLALSNQWVYPNAAIENEFKFEFDTVEKAVAAL